MVPVHLLILAVQTAVTTGTCIVDFTSWTTVTRAVKMDLAALYVPYLVLGECCEIFPCIFRFSIGDMGE